MRKVLLDLTGRQTKIIKTWFDCSRLAYNKALDLCHQARSKGEKKVPKKVDLCRKVANNEVYKDKEQFMLKSPAHIRSEAVRDLHKAYKSAFSLYKKSKGKQPFNLKFKSRKARSDSILIERKNWKNGVLFPTFLGKSKVKSTEKLPENFEHDFRLVKTRTDKYYICYSVDIILPEQQGIANEVLRVISLDPGNRKFICGFDSEGNVIQWGVHDQETIIKLGKKIDHLQSLLSKVKHHAKYKLKKRGLLKQEEIRNKVNELHCKLTTWLCENYDIILLPRYESKNMVRKENERKINSKTARMMMTYSSYRFKQRLINKLREYNDKYLIECTEEYTSKTCCKCGSINDVGGNEVYKCKLCDNCIDRDANGAINIMIKFLTSRSEISQECFAFQKKLGD